MIVTDVVVAGGGPVGLAAAIAIRQRGFRVVVADRARPPIDKPCGEGIMPEGIPALTDLGIACASFSIPFRGIRFTEAGCSAEGLFGDRPGIGLRRTVLHRHLADRAREIGVVLHWGEPIRLLDPFGVELGGAKTLYRWIIGADGRESAVRRWAGFCPPSKKPTRIGLRQRFRIKPWTDLVEVHLHDRGQAVITPVASDEICVSLLANDTRTRAADLFDLYPELKLRLAGAQASSPTRGSICSASKMRHVVRDRVALIGDAAGAMDAITGEGLSLGFRQAIALADALATDCLQQYQAAHRRLRRSPNLISALMLSISGRTRLRRRVVHALAERPSLLKFALAAHTGVAPVTAVPLVPVAGFISNVINGRPFRHTPQLHGANSRRVSTRTMGKVIDLSRKSLQQ